MLGAATFIFSLAQDAGAVASPPYDPSVTQDEANANSEAAASGVPRHPVPQRPRGPVVEEDEEPKKPRPLEGRRLAVIANTKLQLAVTPGIVFVDEHPDLFLGVRAGWGVDLGSLS